MSRNIKEPIKKYLETKAGFKETKVLLGLRRKFKLSDSQAFEVYRRWREEYLSPNYIYSTRISEKITDEKSFIEMIVNTTDYPITKKQVENILNFEREGKNSDWIAKHVGLSYNRVIAIGNRARSRGILQ